MTIQTFFETPNSIYLDLEAIVMNLRDEGLSDSMIEEYLITLAINNGLPIYIADIEIILNL